jgi:hypothetical protein
MTKDEALDLALEALEEIINWYGVRDKNDVIMPPLNQNPEIKESMDAITAIKQARALDKMAENARELGLDYEPVAPVREDWGPGPHECHSLTASVQEPVATIPLGPIANQLANQCGTSGSPVASELHCICGAEWEWRNRDWELVATPPKKQRWAVFCGDCRKEWSVPYEHPGKEICTECEAKLKEKNT